MAAILDVVLNGKVSVDDAVSWIVSGYQKDGPISRDKISPDLDELECIRQTFVPDFLNMLRDQTSHLLQGSVSATQSPAKTPSSLKSKLKVDKSNIHESTPMHVNGQKRNRVLFTPTPLEMWTPIMQRSSPVPTNSKSVNLTFDSPSPPPNERKTDVNPKLNTSDTSDCDFNFKMRTPQNDKNLNNNKQNLSSRNRPKPSLGEFIASSDSHQKHRPKGGKDGSSGRRSAGGRSGKSSVSRRKIQTVTVVEEENPPIFSLNDMDDFPPMGATKSNTSKRSVKSITDSKTAPSRRIMPTPVTANESSSFTSVPDTSPFQNLQKSNVLSSRFADFEREREMLRQKRESVDLKKLSDAKSPEDNSPSRTITPSKPVCLRQSSVNDVASADPSEVTLIDQLNIHVRLYSTLLEEHMVPNLAVELYFLLQILTARGGEMEPRTNDESDMTINCFSTIHNAVYFAVNVLAGQVNTLYLLDKGILKILAENSRLVMFKPEIKGMLLQLHEESVFKNRVICIRSPIGGVSFQAETDNRKNFPNDRAFHIFRKQRDTFYELLREWEERHLDPGWTMADIQGERVRALISGKLDLANHIHFVRLFRSQLLQMCKGDSSLKQEGDDDNVALLIQLKIANPDKFKRLQARFIAPSSTGGPCPVPTFPGCQEFFQEFIVCAANHIFNQHLLNSMSNKLGRLMENSIMQSESNQEATSLDEEDKDILVSNLLAMRLLGKFMGYVTFLPYQGAQNLSDGIQVSYLKLREAVVPPIDIQRWLNDAIKGGHLIIAVPWIVEFLSMCDDLAVHIKYYRSVFETLMSIYHACSQKLKSGSSTLNCLLLILMLGWLFGQASFPEEMFFTGDLKQVLICTEHKSLDSKSIADQSVLHSCCPYLAEFRNLLVAFAFGSGSKGSSIRKITPLSSIEDTTMSITEKQLQNQLEENFFHNQPGSMKRTVDFVGDRVSSNIIKALMASLLPKLMKDGRQEVASMVPGDSLEMDSKMKRKLEQRVYDLSLKLADNCKTRAAEFVNSSTEKRIKEILPHLLADDTSEKVLEIAGEISRRLAISKTKSWIALHITREIFNKELLSELERQLKNPNNPKVDKLHSSLSVVEQVSMSSDQHYSEWKSPSDTLIDAKEILHRIITGRNCMLSEIIDLLKNLIKCLAVKENVINSIPRLIAGITVDLAYALALYQPSLWCEELEQALKMLWKEHLSHPVNLQHALCPKHIYILRQQAKTASGSQKSWETFSKLIVFSIEQNFVNPSELETIWISLLHTHILPEDFPYVITFLNDILTKIRLKNAVNTFSSPGETTISDKPAFFELLTSLEKIVQNDEELLSEIKSIFKLYGDENTSSA